MGKRQVFEIIKDLIISVLIIICIFIILSMVFYDEIALGKELTEAETYELSDSMRSELDDSKLVGEKEEIVNYYIKASDLKKYEKANEYVKGKSNPFAETSQSETNNGTITGGNESTNLSTSGNSGFYEDDGTK